PVVTGKLLDETLGKIHFWLMLIGFNLTFGPMHILGLQGQPRRTYQYPKGMGWDFWNLVATIGSMTIALSIVFFIINIIKTMRSPERAPQDPWDARTLEWTIPSPPPHYNFAEIPVVHARDDFWHRKYQEDEQGNVTPVLAGAAHAPEAAHTGYGGHDEHDIHMPSPSFFPLMASLGF